MVEGVGHKFNVQFDAETDALVSRIMSALAVRSVDEAVRRALAFDVAAGEGCARRPGVAVRTVCVRLPGALSDHLRKGKQGGTSMRALVARAVRRLAETVPDALPGGPRAAARGGGDEVSVTLDVGAASLALVGRLMCDTGADGFDALVRMALRVGVVDDAPRRRAAAFARLRVPVSRRTYVALKSRAATRGVGVGDVLLAALEDLDASGRARDARAARLAS